MKKRVLCIGLVLALALTIIMPATVVAKGETYAEGTISAITPGETRPAGNSGRWIVKERDIVIGFTSGELSGPYALRYHASVDTDDENLQAGNLQGKLHQVIGSDPSTGYPILDEEVVLNVTGTTSPAAGLGDAFNYELLYEGSGLWISAKLYVIHIEGHWASSDGGVGSGTFNGDIYVLICEVDPDDIGYILGLGYNLASHVVGVYPDIPSTITLYD